MRRGAGRTTPAINIPAESAWWPSRAEYRRKPEGLPASDAALDAAPSTALRCPPPPTLCRSPNAAPSDKWPCGPSLKREPAGELFLHFKLTAHINTSRVLPPVLPPARSRATLLFRLLFQLAARPACNDARPRSMITQRRPAARCRRQTRCRSWWHVHPRGRQLVTRCADRGKAVPRGPRGPQMHAEERASAKRLDFKSDVIVSNAPHHANGCLWARHGPLGLFLVTIPKPRLLLPFFSSSRRSSVCHTAFQLKTFRALSAQIRQIRAEGRGAAGQEPQSGAERCRDGRGEKRNNRNPGHCQRPRRLQRHSEKGARPFSRNYQDRERCAASR